MSHTNEDGSSSEDAGLDIRDTNSTRATGGSGGTGTGGSSGAGGNAGSAADAGAPDLGVAGPDSGATDMRPSGAGGAGGAADSGAGGRADGGTDSAINTGAGGAANTGAGGAFDGGTDVPRPAALFSAVTAHDFGHLEMGVTSGAFTWSLSNTGGVVTGTPVVTNADPAEVIVTNGCTAGLAVGGGCSLSVAFKPSTGGPRAPSLTVSATPGGSVSLALTAAGQYRVTVTTAGTGTVSSTPAGINCGATCSTLVDPGTVTLMARTANGAGSVFSAWSANSGCKGPFRDCALNVTGPLTVSATFVAPAANLIFVTAARFPANLGSAIAYDPKCNQAATAAGINDAPGTAYTAFISDAASLAKNRLGTARGWVRMDGMPFADTQTSLINDEQVFNSIRFDETGATLVDRLTFTGVDSPGVLSALNCSNWTTNLETPPDFGHNALYGSSSGGPYNWAAGRSNTCANDQSLICMGKTRAAAVAPTVRTGKKIWQSSFYIPGTQTPDAQCQASRPTGVIAASAFIAFTNRTAASVLSPSTTYVRPDGTVVGTGAQLAAGATLDSGIWQFADGSYSVFPSWTGSDLPGSTGTTDSTCADWTSQTLTMGVIGATLNDNGPFWWSDLPLACNFQNPILCVEL